MRHIGQKLAGQHQASSCQFGVDQHVAASGVPQHPAVLITVFGVLLQVHRLTGEFHQCVSGILGEALSPLRCVDPDEPHLFLGTIDHGQEAVPVEHVEHCRRFGGISVARWRATRKQEDGDGCEEPDGPG